MTWPTNGPRRAGVLPRALSKAVLILPDFITQYLLAHRQKLSAPSPWDACLSVCSQCVGRACADLAPIALYHHCVHFIHSFAKIAEKFLALVASWRFWRNPQAIRTTEQRRWKGRWDAWRSSLTLWLYGNAMRGGAPARHSGDVKSQSAMAVTPGGRRR